MVLDAVGAQEDRLLVIVIGGWFQETDNFVPFFFEIPTHLGEFRFVGVDEEKGPSVNRVNIERSLSFVAEVACALEKILKRFLCNYTN